MRVLGAVLSALLVVGYPLLVYLGATRLSGRGLGLALLSFGLVAAIARAARVESLALRERDARPDRAHLAAALRIPLTVVAIALLGAALDDRRFAMLVPVLVNAALLAQFGLSLRGTPLVERFARMQHPDLSPAQVRHCRAVTVVWCVFFVVNGGVALALALGDHVALWSLHTGVIGYVGMGVLGAGEYLVRKWRFREYGDHLLDRVLARLMPPRSLDPVGRRDA